MPYVNFSHAAEYESDQCYAGALKEFVCILNSGRIREQYAKIRRMLSGKVKNI